MRKHVFPKVAFLALALVSGAAFKGEGGFGCSPNVRVDDEDKDDGSKPRHNPDGGLSGEERPDSGLSHGPKPGENPPPINMVRCACADGTKRESCVPVECTAGQRPEVYCAPACRDHGGVSSGSCEVPKGMCSPPPPPPRGPNLVKCSCGNGVVLEMCAQVDCESKIAQEMFCGPACRDHKGITGTSCAPREMKCLSEPPPPPRGPNLVKCSCGNGVVLEMCAQVDCESKIAQEMFCGPACRDHKGLSGAACAASDVRCHKAM